MIIYQHKLGYRYNSDSLILFDFAKSFLLKGNGLDIGCGSGILSVLLSTIPNIKIKAIDIQEENIKLCNHNFAINNIDFTAECVDFKEYKSDIKYDFLISNPPFYSKEFAKDEHLNISRHSSFLPLDVFLNNASKLLKPNGNFIFCYDAKKIDEILKIFFQVKLKCVDLKFVHTKANKSSNLVLIRAKKVSKSDINIHPALICYDENNNLSKEFSKIYESIKVRSCDL